MKPIASLPGASPDQFPASCEYNLTDFGSAEAWQRVLDDLGLVQDGRNDTGYLWRGADLVVDTASNPITGIHAIHHSGPPEFGYASFMEAHGTPEAVRRFIEAVDTHATMIKGGEPTDVTGVSLVR